MTLPTTKYNQRHTLPPLAAVAQASSARGGGCCRCGLGLDRAPVGGGGGRLGLTERALSDRKGGGLIPYRRSVDPGSSEDKGVDTIA